MTIDYPRELPAWLRVLTPTRFAVVRDQSINRRRGRPMQVIDKSDPYWSLDLTTGNCTADRVAEMEAWVASLRGGLNDMLYRDPRHVTPRTYGGTFDGLTRHGGGAFDGTADVDSIAPATVTVSDLPSTFALKAGDRRIREYQNGNVQVQVRPGHAGIATIHDKDLWIYAISQLVVAADRVDE